MQRLRKQSFPQRYGNMLRSGTQKSRTTKANRKRGVSVSNTPVNRAPIRPILLCGRICAGKSTYAARLKQARGAVVLSCDRLMLTLFGQRLGSWHDGISERVRAYLLAQSVELLQAGLPVILDFGFWRRSDRLAADAFFRGQGFTPEWHYVEVPDAVWRRNIADRNASAAADETAGYAVDAALAEKCSRVFETPAREEMDVWIVNMGET